MIKLVRILAALALGLLLLGAFYAYSRVSRGNMPYVLSEKKISGLVLNYGSQRVELRKESDLWHVQTSSGSLKADPERVRNLLVGLSNVSLADVISESGAQGDLFEVTEASGTRVTLLGAGGKPAADGIFGKQAPDFTHIYFRFVDQPKVYLATGLYRGELSPGNPADWLHLEKSTATHTH